MSETSLWQRLRHHARQIAQARSPAGRFFLFAWRHRLTGMGRVTFVSVILAGPAAATLTNNLPLYYFALFLFSLLLVSRTAGWLLRPKVAIDRDLPERCPVGAELRIHARLRNEGRWTAYDVAISEHQPHEAISLEARPDYLDVLPPGEEAEAVYRLTPTERGAFDFAGPVALTAFPFGLYHHGKVRKAPRRVLVHPRFAPLSGIHLPVGRRYQPGGLQLTSHVGDSEEFIGNREYRPGDRLRDLDHRAWARLGAPVVREFQQEYLSRVALLVDTHVPLGDDAAEAALEAALSLGAGVADALSRQEYVIDIFAAGPDLYHFQAGRSLAYLENILDILACIGPCRHNPFETLAPAVIEEIQAISTAVVILLDWDERRERFVRLVRDYGVAVKIVVVREGPPAFDPAGFVSDGGTPVVLSPLEVEAGVERL